MDKELKCSKCGSEKRVKSGFDNKKQRYLCKISHVSVINWVKKAGAQLEKFPKKDEKVEVLELDELCINFKKTSGSGPR